MALAKRWELVFTNIYRATTRPVTSLMPVERLNDNLPKLGLGVTIRTFQLFPDLKVNIMHLSPVSGSRNLQVHPCGLVEGR